jgi:SAM-dependent methyltransferase
MDVLDGQRAAWAGLAASWEKWDALIMDQLAPVGAAIIDGLGIAPGQHHLDIASGTGEPGLSIAKLAPEGRVVLTDLSPEMLSVASRRAQTAGVSVETVVCSADDLPFPDASFDSVSVRFGYMFFPDLAKATAEFVRVLRPGGRLCASVWVDPSANPWTSVAMEAIATSVALPTPAPDSPGMYRCAAPGSVSRLYDAAGLRAISEWDVPVALVTTSADQYWTMISEHVSLAAAALQQASPSARDNIRSHALAAISAFEHEGAIRVPGLARCILGTK